MNKTLLIGGGIAFLFIASGVYFFVGGDDLMAQKNQTQAKLTAAEKKLNKEKETLGTMLADIKNAAALTLGVEDQTKKASDLINQTDFLFTDPDGSNPKLIFVNPLTSIFIANQRKEMNLLLAEWQKQSSFFVSKNIGISESEKIREQAEAIKSFLQDLAEIFESLTPTNSGLSQHQIDAYAAQLPSVEEIDEVLVALSNVIANYNASYAETFHASDSSGGVDSQTPQNSSSSTPSVTAAEVAVQQGVVIQAEAEVVVLQEQLTNLEQQTHTSSPPPPPADTETVVETDLEIPTTITPSTNTNFEVPYTRSFGSQGIIIQPGPPRLIQGIDAY